MHTPSAQDIQQAHERIKPYIHHTPVMTNQTINELAGCEVYFKCENLQKIGAFKFRGATNALLTLSKKELNRGVATHSSGNHAQALALAAKILGVKAYIVMPRNAPNVKKAAVMGYGAEVIECEPSLIAREETLQKVVAQTGATFIHPYNDERIICGQATAAKELLEEQPDLQHIVAPVGGGGLLSGTALSVHYFAPEVKVTGAEPEGARDAYESFHSGRFHPSVSPNTIADGLLTSLGDKTFPLIQKYVHDIRLANEEQIKKALRLVWERMKLVIEPSSAVPLAVVLENPDLFKGKKVGIIISGGNVDLGKLPF